MRAETYIASGVHNSLLIHIILDLRDIHADGNIYEKRALLLVLREHLLRDVEVNRERSVAIRHVGDSCLGINQFLDELPPGGHVLLVGVERNENLEMRVLGEVEAREVEVDTVRTGGLGPRVLFERTEAGARAHELAAVVLLALGHDDTCSRPNKATLWAFGGNVAGIGVYVEAVAVLGEMLGGQCGIAREGRDGLDVA